MPYGVTPEMIARYQDVVFEKSTNVQTRRGDPIRTRDWAAVEGQREQQGLTDAQIAAQLGLTEDQVTFIRIVAERERFRLESHSLLYELHGNRASHVGTYPAREAERGRAPMRPIGEQIGQAPGGQSFLRGQTLGGVLRAQSSRRSGHLALVDRGRGLRYQDLLQRSQALAGGLRSLGIGAGDVVSAQLPGCAELFFLHVAVAELGAVLNPIPMTYRAREVEYVLRDARSKAIVLPGGARYAEAVDLVERLRPGLSGLAHVLLVGGEGRAETIDLAHLHGQEPTASDGSASDPFVLLYTSGTEGPAKGVIHPHDTLLSNAFWLVNELGIEPGDALLTASPIAHLFALYLFYLGIHAGARQVILEHFDPVALADLIAAERVTVLAMAPAQLQALLQVPGLEGRDLSALRLVVTSGAPCPASVYEDAARRLDCAVVNQWGMTELQAGALTRPGDPLERVLATAGRPAPGVELCVADDLGNAVPPGAEGHLWYRSPYLFTGYHEKPEATRAAFAPGGWFRTGDLAALEADGSLRLVGRSKELINRGGVKFHPGEIEELLLGHPAIREVAIVPMPDARLGERACLYAVPRDGADLELDDVVAYLLDQGVAKYKLPERLELLPELPTTSSRKIQKGLLRDDIARKLADEARPTRP